MPLVTLKELEETTVTALERHGALPWIAEEVARAVCVAESVGNKICGLFYFESYCEQLDSGRVKGDVEPEISFPKPGAVNVDAKFGFAQPAFARGLPKAVEAAQELGIASLAIGHSHTATSLGYFTEQIARAGFIGLGTTNASARVAPPGGKTPILGTNPMSFSVPDGNGGVAMLFDHSTSSVALGRISMAKALGKQIPEGWALDSEGHPTTDADAALAGSLSSMGGYKGWGLGLMVELLAAGMTGSVVSQDVQPLKAKEGAPHDLGQYYLLIDPSVSGAFFERLGAINSAVAEEESTRIPGQNKQYNDPVDVDQAVWDRTLELAGMTKP